ncbi:hypothetical protein [Streptomyces sp. NPDC002845]
MKRTALAATSALALTVLTTGCGSGEEETDATDKPEATATASQAKELTRQERLAELMVTKAEVGGGYDSKEYTLDGEYIFAKSQDEVTLDKAVCAPLAHAINQLPLGDAEAFLTHGVSKNALTQGSNYVTLNSYADEDTAKAAVSGLSNAVDSCGDGFTAEANGNTSTHDSVTAEDIAPAGDESLAFNTTLTFRGVTHTMHGAAVRSGDVVAVYFSVNGLAIANSRPSDAKLPAAVVEAQNAKLG